MSSGGFVLLCSFPGSKFVQTIGLEFANICQCKLSAMKRRKHQDVAAGSSKDKPKGAKKRTEQQNKEIKIKANRAKRSKKQEQSSLAASALISTLLLHEHVKDSNTGVKWHPNGATLLRSLKLCTEKNQGTRLRLNVENTGEFDHTGEPQRPVRTPAECVEGNSSKVQKVAKEEKVDAAQLRSVLTFQQLSADAAEGRQSLHYYFSLPESMPIHQPMTDMTGGRHHQNLF